MSILAWQTPLLPPHTHQRSGRLLLGRAPPKPPPPPRNFSDSQLAQRRPPHHHAAYPPPPSVDSVGMRTLYGPAAPGTRRGGYAETLARFSLLGPTIRGGNFHRRPAPTGPSHPFPSPPEQTEMDEAGLEDILNNRAMLAAANALGGTYPSRSHIRRGKMVYYIKFGEQGQEVGKFSEPSGVAVNNEGDLVVADTNNHRIQVFYPDGRFKFAFGECGKRDGQLLYPNRVAIYRKTGDIIITERSPTHQVQVFSARGEFLAKFGATILQHPRGVAVDAEGRIIVVECKVMRVLIFEMSGRLVSRFDCSAQLEFPNGVAVNDRQEIFVSDNRAHAVKVFDYQGHLLRTIGGEGITNFPIGVGINHLGQVVVADNHNNFNVTLFTQEGRLVYGQESKVKHAQCFDVALLANGSIALASKDYRLYLYRYEPAPSSSGSSSLSPASSTTPSPPPQHADANPDPDTTI